MQAAINYFSSTVDQSLVKQGAYHQAGYATAIYLRNQQDDLPPIYFQINRSYRDVHIANRERGHGLPFNLEGGRLIDPLTVSINECVSHLSLADQEAFKIAFEADIINLLVGAYAEIKYVNNLGLRSINRHAINFKTMEEYFGPYWFDCTKSYLSYFFSDLKQQENKIAELFSRAQYYVNKSSHWLLIGKLANYLIKDDSNCFSYEQIVNFINKHEQALPVQVAVQRQNLTPN